MHPNKIVRALSAVLWLGLCGLSPDTRADVGHVTLWQQVVHPWLQFKSSATPNQGTQSPTEAIRELDRQLGSYRTGKVLSEADKLFNRQLKQRILSGTFDIRELCRISLGKHWSRRTEAERDHLVALMTSLLEEKAVTSKEQTVERSGSSNVYSVRYLGDTFLDPKKKRAKVRSKVFVPSHNIAIEISYKLQRAGVGNPWKIYDVIVDDSSLVENYAYQFESIIAKHGYADLVARMERKLREFRGEVVAQ